MKLSTIAIINLSSRISKEQIAAIAMTVSLQAVTFCKAWDIPCPLVIARDSLDGALDSWGVLIVVDEAGDPGALGYHTLYADRVVGEISVSPVLDSGGTVLGDPADRNAVSVSSVVSHEVLESIADPTIALWAEIGGRLVAYEVCDPVEAMGYDINNVSVSNWVYPAWFDAQSHGPYDFLQSIDAPGKLAAGGYVIDYILGSVFAESGELRPWRRHSVPSPGFRSANRLAKS